MGKVTMIEAALKDGRMTLEQIRKDYELRRVHGKMPPDFALRHALNIRSSGALASFKRFAYQHVDTNGRKLPKRRVKVFSQILEVLQVVEDKMLDDWSQTAEKMQSYDPFRYAKAMHPDIMAQASDGAIAAEVAAALDRAMVAVQSLISGEAERLAQGALERLAGEGDPERRQEILRTLVVESFQGALAGGQYFEA